MSLAPGRSLSHYRLVEQIGEGGMGVVWRATDTTLGRDVAIKVLPEAVANDPERMARFEREARLLASLNHSNIAAIYGVGADEGVRFLAMELIEGDDLATRVEQGPIPVVETLQLAVSAAPFSHTLMILNSPPTPYPIWQPLGDITNPLSNSPAMIFSHA